MTIYKFTLFFVCFLIILLIFLFGNIIFVAFNKKEAGMERYYVLEKGILLILLDLLVLGCDDDIKRGIQYFVCGMVELQFLISY